MVFSAEYSRVTEKKLGFTFPNLIPCILKIYKFYRAHSFLRVLFLVQTMFSPHASEKETECSMPLLKKTNDEFLA